MEDSVDVTVDFKMLTGKINVETSRPKVDFEESEEIKSGEVDQEEAS